jgi:hypothetical protein
MIPLSIFSSEFGIARSCFIPAIGRKALTLLGLGSAAPIQCLSMASRVWVDKMMAANAVKRMYVSYNARLLA